MHSPELRRRTVTQEHAIAQAPEQELTARDEGEWVVDGSADPMVGSGQVLRLEPGVVHAGAPSLGDREA
jgi:hypothetical protein